MIKSLILLSRPLYLINLAQLFFRKQLFFEIETLILKLFTDLTMRVINKKVTKKTYATVRSAGKQSAARLRLGSDWLKTQLRDSHWLRHLHKIFSFIQL